MQNDHPTVAVLGTGLMGAPMAGRLLRAGYPVTVWNRTPARARKLEAEGAVVASAPSAALAASRCVVLMLRDGPVIDDVLFDDPKTRGKLAGRTVLQMGTIGPEESMALAEKVHGAKGQYLEAPVLGSIPEATAGTLIIMAGGDPALFERWRPILRVLGRQVSLIGPVGHAAVLKLAMNQLIATMAATYSMGLELVRTHGVHVKHYIETVRASALHSKAFDKKLPRMLERDFSNPNFPARHMLKDVDLCLAAAQARGLGAEVLAGLHDLFTRTMELGLADADYSAVDAAVSRRRESCQGP